MKKGIIFGIILIVVVLTGYFVFSPTQNENDQGAIKIGVILSLTNKGATYGERSLNGIRLAIEELNKSEKFEKTPIDLLVEDSHSSSNGAVNAFNKLIAADNIQVVVGLVLSDEVLSCAPIANKNKIVLFTPGAGSTKIAEAGEYIFRNRESASIQTKKIVEVCFDNGHNNVAILYSNAANGVSYKNSFKNKYEKLGGEINIEIGYTEGKTDYRTEIQRLINSQIKAVYLAGLDTELGIILKQAYETNFSPQFYASAGAISDNLLNIAKKGADGMICVTASFDIESTDEKVVKFKNSFEKKYDSTPDWVAANSYDAVSLIAEIMISGAKTGEDIRGELHSKEFDGVTGKTLFDEKGEVIRDARLVKVENGTFVNY